MIKNVLTIAGSDSGGGAGIQADLKALSAQGVYGASVITAVTAQNTKAVTAIHGVPPAIVTQQIDAVFDDLEIAATKIGMLQDAATIVVVVEGIVRHRAQNVVVDPVMVAKSQARLLEATAVDAMRRLLLPVTDILTPNLPEAGDLLDRSAPRDEAEMLEAGRALLLMGPKAVLMKGGHLEGAMCVDLLITDRGTHRFERPRVASKNTHGTGCTLSATLAAQRALGQPIELATEMAIDYVAAAIRAADRLDVGTGHGPLHHFHTWW